MSSPDVTEQNKYDRIDITAEKKTGLSDVAWKVWWKQSMIWYAARENATEDIDVFLVVM